jgi:hypothetical protein
MRGHTFPTPRLFDSAFVTSQFSSSSELGVFDQPGVTVIVDDDTDERRVFQYDRSLGFVGEHLGIEIASLPTLAIGLDGSYTALVGSNDESIFLFGGATSYEIHPGVRLRILRSTATGTQLGARAFARVSGGLRIRPAGLIEELARQVQALASDLQRVACLAAGAFSCAFPSDFNAFTAMQIRRREIGGGASVSVAQALGSRFGVQASLSSEIGLATVSSAEAGEVASTPIALSVGVAPSVDLAPTIPLGAMIEYRFRAMSESFVAAMGGLSGSSRSIQNSVAGGVYYTGRRDLGLGLIFTGDFSASSLLSQSSSTREPLNSMLTATLSMRYFF